MATQERVIPWLLATDPGVAWQVQRDLLDEPEKVWSGQRHRVETEGWGAELLSHRDADGQWAGAAFWAAGFTREDWEREGQPWTATCWALAQLREFGLDPASPSARRTVELVGANSRWEEGDQPYWEGEVEECINGRTVADGAYFGVDVAPIVERLVGELQPDGGWNCERSNGSVRSSFDSTINVLEGLAEFERTSGGTPASRAARAAGEEYLLERRLFRRLSDGRVVDPEYLQPASPHRWRYDVVRALDYFRSAATLDGRRPDPRLAEAADIVRGLRWPDGRWRSERTVRGRSWLTMDAGVGQASPWITLKALRVLRWLDA
jgi:hypothetical protein